MRPSFAFTGNYLIVATSLFLTIFYNTSYYQKVLEIHPVSIGNTAFLLSIIGLQLAATILLISIFSFKGLLKPIVILLLLTSSISSYIMDVFGTIFGDEMMQQIVALITGHSFDLLSTNLFLYLIFLGIMPSLFILRTPVKFNHFKQEFINRLQLIALSLSAAILIILLFYSSYNTLFKAKNPIKYYANPIYFTYSGIDSLISALSSSNQQLNPSENDAIIAEMDGDRELVIMVLGEAARADRFSLNGYPRLTNPLLQQEKLTSFEDFSACGTSTSVSVSCIFSEQGSQPTPKVNTRNENNLIDIMSSTGINILWRDNNKRSNQFSSLITYENFRTAELNPECDSECRDEGMLVGLQEYIDDQKTDDIFIVLHQIGSQGPAYYKRYPQSFEIFTPACKTSQLVNCTQQEINNAYDNSIRYTDHFLAKTIALLKQNQNNFETAMLYVSDHGVSLGEKGVYLHGLPTFIAPEKQIHVASVLWISEQLHHADIKTVQRKSKAVLSHDNLFHTLLGLFEIQTSAYNPSKDILSSTW